MIRQLGTMAVIEPFQKDVSRTDDRAVSRHAPAESSFFDPFAAICRGVFGVYLHRFLKFSVTNVRYAVPLAGSPPPA